jgi:hypothetical protein
METMLVDPDLFADDTTESDTTESQQESPAATAKVEGATIFDIETGPRPWAEIEQFFDPPVHPGDFDPSTVKLGNLKDQAKIAAKVQAARESHLAAVEKYDSGVTAAKESFIAEAALSPVTGCVLAIGYCGKAGDIIDGDVKDERDLLSQFWDEYRWSAETKQPMVGFNIFGFDLPFLIRRSWLLDVDVPADVIRDNRFWSKVFIDLMVVWGLGAYGDRIKLDRVAAYFGCTRKSGSGADFHKLWRDPATRSQAIEYLKTDLQVTVEVATKMGVI